MIRRLIRATALAALTAAALPAGATYLRNVPQELVQPDGRVLQCVAEGDQHHHWVSCGGYTVVRDGETGAFVYADVVRDRGLGERLAPTECVVGRCEPRSRGIEPGRNIGAAAWHDRAERNRERFVSGDGLSLPGKAPSTGNVRPLVVFVRFRGEEPLSTPRATVEAMLNDTSSESSLSLRSYYRHSSYGQLDIEATLLPSMSSAAAATGNDSYEDSEPRGYYQPASASNPEGYTNSISRYWREQKLLANALRAVSSQVPADLDVDADDDGKIDNVIFILKGNPEGWGELLWPHMSVMVAQSVEVNGAKLWAYNVNLEGVLDASVLCHEFGHSMGMPDFYRYDNTEIAPTGSWDLMATDRAQQMTAHLKSRYLGWEGDLPVAEDEGVYTLASVGGSPSGHALVVNSPYSSTDHFVIENRWQGDPFDGGIPESGLIVYRVNEWASFLSMGNGMGPPDELYVFRPGGTSAANGKLSQAALSAESGRTEFGLVYGYHPFLSNGEPAGFAITDVSASGPTVSFRLLFTDPATPSVSAAASGD